MRDEIKQQNFNFNKQMNEISTRCDTITEPVSYTHLSNYQLSYACCCACPIKSENTFFCSKYNYYFC